MLIRKQEKGLLATPLKWLGYLGMATVIIITMYRGIRVFDQITEDQDMETLNAGINTIELIHTEGLDAISFAAFERQFDLVLKSMKQHLISEEAHILRSDTFGIERYFNETDTFKKCEFYHGAGPGISAAISYCEHRGFWGRITTEDGVYDIEKIDGDRHRVISVDPENEMGEFQVNGYREFIPKSDAGEPPISRRLSAGAAPAIQFPNCATIEMLLIQLPSIQNADKYRHDATTTLLDEDSLAMLLEANILFKNTHFKKDGVEFMCFNLLLAAILKVPEYSVGCDSHLDWGGVTDCSTVTISGGPPRLNGDYSRYLQCVGGVPYFVHVRHDDLQIFYDSSEEMWFVSSFAHGSRKDLAKCTTGTKSRGYQELKECIGGKWEYEGTTATGWDQINICPDSSGQPVAQTITIDGFPFNTENDDYDLNGDYSRTAGNGGCDTDQLPEFTKNDLELVYKNEEWILQQQDCVNCEFAKCATPEVVSLPNDATVQDLRACTEGMWEYLGNQDGSNNDEERAMRISSLGYASIPSNTMKIDTSCPGVNDWFTSSSVHTQPQCWTKRDGQTECWADDTRESDHHPSLDKVVHYVEAHIDQQHDWKNDATDWTYDATYGLRGVEGGEAMRHEYLSVICGNDDIAAVGAMNPRVFAHELGHNLGAEHDQDHICGDHGGDFGHVMGYAGDYDDEVAEVNSFSHCTILQFYEQWRWGNYDCLWRERTSTGLFHHLAGHCGNGQVEGSEECDDYNDQCCDPRTCTFVRGCCKPGAVFQCVEVRNQGNAIKIYGPSQNPEWDEMLTDYVGYYGGCVGDSDSDVTPVYEESKITYGRNRMHPFFLKHVDDYILAAGSDTGRSAGSDDWWLFSSDKEVSCISDPCNGHRAEMVCNTALPDCQWKSIYDPDVHSSTLTLQSWNEPTLTTTILTDSSFCLSESCFRCLDWNLIPNGVSIKGAEKHTSMGILYQDGDSQWKQAKRTIDLNGIYTRDGNEGCINGFPVFVKDFLHIFYEFDENRWYVSYYGNGAEHLDLARCDSAALTGEDGAYQHLLRCIKGQWSTAQMHEDYERFTLEPNMMIAEQWGPPVCFDTEQGYVPDKIVIDGDPVLYGDLNGEYLRESNGDCVLTPKFVKDGLQIVYDSDINKWTVSNSDSSLAICVSGKFVGDYQDLLSCTEEMWQIHIGGKWRAKPTMKILDQWDVCVPPDEGRILGTISISGIGSTSFTYKQPGGEFHTTVDFSGDYTSIWSDNCGIDGEQPSFYKDLGTYARLERLEITYKSQKWFVQGMDPKDPVLKRIDLARCDRQDLSQCTAGRWQIHDDFSADFKTHYFEPNNDMTIEGMTTNSGWETCLKWDPHTPRFTTRHVDTIEIHFDESTTSESILRRFSGVYKATYRSAQNRECDVAMPRFVRQYAMLFSEIYYVGEWKVRGVADSAWVDYAKCTEQDLRRCTEGTWNILEDGLNFVPEPTMTIHAMYQSMDFNWIPHTLNSPSNFNDWFNCQDDCDKCLDWSGGWNSDSFCDTVSIANAQSSVLNGVYTMKENRRCIGGMPFFELDDLQIVYIPSEGGWFVSSFEDDTRIDHAKCISDKDLRKYQNLKACNKKWRYRETSDGQWSVDRQMRLTFDKKCPSMSKWFEPPKKCATRPELAENLWRTFWTNVESRIGRRKKTEVESKAKVYFNANSLDDRENINSWGSLRRHLKNNACAYGAEVCAFRESVLDSCDQVEKCKNMLGERDIMDNINSWVTT